MALAKPTAPELARYTFFVSRRREEGRERFRLHMGYFTTRDEAEQMLQLVRDLYPAAWVGETPGRKLAQGAPRPATPAAAPTPTPTPAPAPAPVPEARPPAAVVAPPPAVVAPPPARVAPAARPAASAAPPVQVVTATAPAAADVAAPRPTAPSPAPRTAMPPASNVREVIAALEPDIAASGTVQMPIPPPPVTGATRAAARAAASPPAPAAGPARPPVAAAAKPAVAPPAKPSAAAAAKPLPPATVAARPPAVAKADAAPRAAAPAVPAVQSTTPGADMTDSQVLRVLEGRGATPQGRSAAAPEGVRDIALLSPQDTQTWRDIKAQIKREAVVHFAVQLNWSVTPIDLGRVPSLAIFNAYTLYKIEGNREGRKWYGLRLGFFSDAVSAKQVAHYVRSEFAQVAVVPVSVNEREQAKQIGAIALPTPAPRAPASSSEEFKLIDDDPPAAPASPVAEEIELSTPAAPSRPVAASPAARGPAATTRRPNRPRGAPQSLEETLEILGASQLSIDNGRGERVVLDGRPRATDSPTSTFVRLLDRLGEKLRK